jgi:hypothetical protein
MYFMITHIALFVWKENADPIDIQRALEDVKALREKVPGLIDIKYGENFSRWSEGFTHAVIVLAESEESLDAYRKHPDHVDVAQRIEAMESKSLGVDFKD